MQDHPIPCKQIVFFAAFCLLTLLSLPSFAENTPSDAVKSFYQLVSKQQCKKALLIRPNYSFERCEKITKTHIHKVTTELSDNKNAVVLLELDSFFKNKKNYFFGYVKLVKKKNKWLIVGPFKNREDYWLDEYINAYISEGIHGLSIEEKEKKFTPPPVKRLNSKKIPTKEAETILPSSDSIDDDEANTKPQQMHIKKGIPNNTTIIQESTTPEADKFIFGKHPIEGNYTSLLRMIRKNFPKEATSNILLIDQSRHTIYIYSNTDLLLAFFPILSSDNSNFPSGLYRLNTKNILGLVNQKEPIKNQAITLERIQKIILTESTAHPKYKKKIEQYYIRDLFDTDKKNTLQLSPIDNNKLQLLILPSTMAYKGQ